jgi:hypothetical protein
MFKGAKVQVLSEITWSRSKYKVSDGPICFTTTRKKEKKILQCNSKQRKIRALANISRNLSQIPRCILAACDELSLPKALSFRSLGISLMSK